MCITAIINDNRAGIALTDQANSLTNWVHCVNTQTQLASFIISEVHLPSGRENITSNVVSEFCLVWCFCKKIIKN